MDRDFIATADVVVGYNDHLNEYIGLFLVTVIDLERPKYSFGRKWKTHLAETEIKLPINQKGEPDWQFMEDFIKEKYKKVEKKTTTKIKLKPVLLDSCSWKNFRISDLFKCSIACSEDFGNMAEGRIPFIGRSESDNGLQGYVDTDKINKGQCITIGMVGTMKPYWQENDFAASQNILILYNNKLNRYSALFLTTVLKHIIQDKYSYNRPIQKEKFKGNFIKLPVDSQGNPDWQFMENYIKSLPYSDLI